MATAPAAQLVRVKRKLRRAADRALALLRPQTAYARWREDQLAAIWPGIDLRFGSGSDLVLGVATGYRYETVRPFVQSLRAASRCRALLVVNDRALAARLAEEEIDSVMWQRPTGYAPHPNFARVAALLGVLRAVRGVDRAFLLDTRDVIFQSDPFSPIPDGRLRFFTEAAGQTFANERTNRRWLVNSLGEGALAQFENFDIVCAGTVSGSIDALVEYCRLKLLLGGLFGPTRHLGSGIDQLTTNFIARFRMLPDAEIMPFDGPVATPCYANDGMIPPDGRGAFRFINGTKPAIIHQWDRSTAMQPTIMQRYG